MCPLVKAEQLPFAEIPEAQETRSSLFDSPLELPFVAVVPLRPLLTRELLFPL